MADGPDPEPAEAANPFAAPAATPQRVIVLPGWLVFLFAITALLVPCTISPRQPETWVLAAMYGLPGAVAAVIFALANLRVGVHRRLSWLALAVTIGSVVATVLRLVL